MWAATTSTPVPHVVADAKCVDAAAIRRGALLLALLAIVVRLALVLMPGPNVSPDWVLPEELHRGNVAREVLEGPLLDVQDYHHAPNVGGSVVVALLAVPFVASMGESLLAVRMPTVLLHGLAVALLFVIVARRASRGAAWVAGALFAIAPVGYALVSITAWGTHVENNTLVLLALWMFLRLDGRREEERGQGRRGALLGLVCGFGCYFGYSFAAALATLGVLAFVRDRAFVLRRWFPFWCAGFAVGFAPWVRYNLEHDFAALSVYDGTFVAARARGLGALVAKLAWFWGEYVPRSTFLRRFELADLSWAELPATLAVYALAIAGLVAAHRAIASAARRFVRMRAEPPPLDLGLVCAVQLLVFTAAMLATRAVQTELATDIAHDGRYAAPIVPFLCIAAGLGVAALADRGPVVRWIARGVAGALVVLYALGFAAQIDAKAWPGSAETPGTSDEALALWFAWQYKRDVGRIERLVDGLESKRSEDVRDGTIFVVAEVLKSRLMAIPPGDARRGAFRERCRAALRFLRERVRPRYRIYCEEPWPGEKLYAWGQRAEFRRAYEEHRASERRRAAEDASSK